MVFNEIINTIILLALVVGSITDIRKREVPDWLNYGLIFTGLGIRLLFSAISSDSSFIIEGLIGFAVFFVLAYVMFYAGQWGGGDAKMLMGLGALIGLKINVDSFLAGFIINALLLGAIYGMVWSIVLGVIHRKKFLKELNKIRNEDRIVKLRKITILGSGVLFIVVLIFVQNQSMKIPFLSLIMLYVLAFYTWMFTKTIEQACMLKDYDPEKLTEGDWIPEEIWTQKNKKESLLDFLMEKNKKNKENKLVNSIRRGLYLNSDNPLKRIIYATYYYCIFRRSKVFNDYRKTVKELVRSTSEDDLLIKKLKQINNRLNYIEFIKNRYQFDYNRRYICGPNDLGIEKEQIQDLINLKKRDIIKKVMVKEGIPFVPSFLMAFFATYFFGNLFFLIL